MLQECNLNITYPDRTAGVTDHIVLTAEVDQKRPFPDQETMLATIDDNTAKSNIT